MAYERIPIARKDGQIDMDSPLPRKVPAEAMPAKPRPLPKPVKRNNGVAKFVASAVTVGALMGVMPSMTTLESISKAAETTAAVQRVPTVGERLQQYAIPNDGEYVAAVSRHPAAVLNVLDEFAGQGYDVAYMPVKRVGVTWHKALIAPKEGVQPLVTHLKTHEKANPQLIAIKAGQPHTMDLESRIFDERVDVFKDMPYFSTVKEAVREADKHYEIGDPREFMALGYSIIETESHFNPKTVSHKGARGLMQVMPDTGRLIDRIFGRKPMKLRQYKRILMDEETSIQYGIPLLAKHFEEWGKRGYTGERQRALTAAEYNSGYNNVMKRFIDTPWKRQIPETRDYVVKIERKYQHYLERQDVPFYVAQQEAKAAQPTAQPGA